MAQPPSSSVFLHGSLQVHVLEARGIEQAAAANSAISSLCCFQPSNSHSNHVQSNVTVTLGDANVMSTHHVQQLDNPAWNAQTTFRVAHNVAAVDFILNATNSRRSVALLAPWKTLLYRGLLAVPSSKLRDLRVVEGWFPLVFRPTDPPASLDHLRPHHANSTTHNSNEDDDDDDRDHNKNHDGHAHHRQDHHHHHQHHRRRRPTNDDIDRSNEATQVQDGTVQHPQPSHSITDDQPHTSLPADADTSLNALAQYPNSASQASLHIRLVFIPIGQEPSRFYINVHVPECYFPPRHGAKVTLYQTAEVPPGSVPLIPPTAFPMSNAGHGRCWRDIATKIASATEFIYIAGWSVWTELKLVRSNYPGDAEIPHQDMTLGELLIWKADRGVTVCVMVWDEFASTSLAGGRLNTDGVMGTHDERVLLYFKYSKVRAIKVSRLSTKKQLFARLRHEVLFTHHQKTVIVASEDPACGKCRVEAFLGGLDLTNGRYDTPEHSLFRTLQGVHAPPDFYQACALNVRPEAGPREPWQDIHAHLTGSAAWDVLANFEDRWTCQAPRAESSALHPHSLDRFVTLSEEDRIRDGTWSVQVLRSISIASAALDADRPGLTPSKFGYIDCSIHYGYVHQIRRATNFIYLENQYFVGSSHLWDSGQRGDFASNLIPIELAMKICAKIREGQRFAVYLVIPLFPEGPPASAAVQEILSHQRKSINLITTRIAATIKETRSNTEISDWFNIFCLVNRESSEGNQGSGGINPTEKELAASRRFMIYVHSKFAVFDDTAAIVGSANINSRSLDGDRDTEIAALVWQPQCVAAGSTAYGHGSDRESTLPRGAVAAFRGTLWATHLGKFYEEFLDPSSLTCLKLVRNMAKANLDHFLANDKPPMDMPHGHLCLYPYAYDEQGRVETTIIDIPDFNGALMKGKAGLIPNVLTG